MTVTLTQEGPLALLTLNRPEALNALSFEIIAQIDAALVQVATLDVRALIITGAGSKAFCAGADIPELMHRGLAQQKLGAERGQATFSRLDRLPVPSIAAIDGYAFGGGLELALACTFRIASSKSRMGLPEVKLGLIPGYGGTQRLPRLVGAARALEMILTAQTVDAAEALRIGLVNQVVQDDVLGAAAAFAERFSGYGKLALSLARDAVLRGMDVDLPQGLRIEADLSILAFQTTDAEEGLRAFVDKRTPHFKDC